MSEKETSTDHPTETAADHDWDSRKLCSDGNCIGVIGTDGTCKECGKPYRGDPFDDNPLWSADEEPDAFDDSETRSDPADDSGNPANTDRNEEWENRKLCSDGNCIGVIGPGGTCKECGKPYAPED